MDAPHGAKPRPSWRAWVIHVTLAVVLVAILWKVIQVFVIGNFHEVIPGRLYRGAQPSPRELERLIDRYKLRTVLNVRGCCHPQPWYVAEAEVCARRGVNLEDVCFSANQFPSRHELRRLVDVLDRAETPIFVHCRQGADRAGIASMAAQLLLDEQSYASAHRQLGLHFGHLPVGKPTTLDRFFQLYADWLTDANKEHAPAYFRHWLLHEYNGADCDARFESVKRRFDAPRVRQALEYDVVVRNTGSRPWQFRTLKGAGHHVAFKLVDDQNDIIHEGRAGMLDRTVSPGEKIQLTLIIPPQATAGHYRLFIDMTEEGHCWFYQTGSELWEEGLDIRE